MPAPRHSALTKPTSPPPWHCDLVEDVGETHGVAAAHPEIVARLQKAAEDFDRDLEAHSRPIHHVAL